MAEKFDSIRHFNMRELPAAAHEILHDKTVQQVIHDYNFGIPLEKLQQTQFTHLYDFQKEVLGRFLKYYSDRSTTEVSYTILGDNHFDEPRLYIANHRDIIMDSAYLQLYFFDHNLNSTKIAIGDNLVPDPLTLKIAKANNQFTVTLLIARNIFRLMLQFDLRHVLDGFADLLAYQLCSGELSHVFPDAAL